MIKLTNIDLSNVTYKQQIEKIEEEDTELLKAIMKEDTANIIEEFWDCVQARLGLLDKVGINASKVMEGYEKHLEKLKHRPR